MRSAKSYISDAGILFKTKNWCLNFSVGYSWVWDIYRIQIVIGKCGFRFPLWGYPNFGRIFIAKKPEKSPKEMRIELVKCKREHYRRLLVGLAPKEIGSWYKYVENLIEECDKELLEAV